MITNENRKSTFTPSRWRRIFCSLLLMAAVVAIMGAIASSRQSAVAAPGGGAFRLHSSKIAPGVMAHTANGQEAELSSCLPTRLMSALLPSDQSEGAFRL